MKDLHKTRAVLCKTAGDLYNKVKCLYKTQNVLCKVTAVLFITAACLCNIEAASHDNAVLLYRPVTISYKDPGKLYKDRAGLQERFMILGATAARCGRATNSGRSLKPYFDFVLEITDR